jgi:pSer/pThr/pTyr-binding forkhead associated (FHA) protein
MQATRLQTEQLAKLFHVQTKTYIDLSPNLSIIYIGKPNKCIPPDIDVSIFPSSHTVSRIHANILVDNNNNYLIEDLESTNGTYLNHSRLTPLIPRQLNPGDRIDLGKDNQVTFIFQLNQNITTTASKAKNQEEEQVAIFQKLLGLGLMLGGLGFLAESITIDGILNAPVIFLSIAGILFLQYGGINRNFGWVLIGIGVAIAITTKPLFLTPITLLNLLLTVSVFSAGYQLFTAGKVFKYNFISLKKVLIK